MQGSRGTLDSYTKSVVFMNVSTIEISKNREVWSLWFCPIIPVANMKLSEFKTAVEGLNSLSVVILNAISVLFIVFIALPANKMENTTTTRIDIIPPDTVLKSSSYL